MEPEREKLRVVLGTVPLAGVLGWLGLNHWALQVGEVWHEVGPGPDNNTGHIDAASDLRDKNIIGEYKIRTNTGDRATSKAEPTPINDLWLTNLLLPAFLIGVILGPAVWALGVPLQWATFLGLLPSLVTLVPRLENCCRQVKGQLGEEGTGLACVVGLTLVVALLGPWGQLGMLGLLAVWWFCRVKWPMLLNTWQDREPNRNSILGTTCRTEEEMAQFDEVFEMKNPKYLGLSTNCQRYVRDLFAFLMKPPHGEKAGDLPPPESIGSIIGLFNSEQQKKMICKGPSSSSSLGASTTSGGPLPSTSQHSPSVLATSGVAVTRNVPLPRPAATQPSPSVSRVASPSYPTTLTVATTSWVYPYAKSYLGDYQMEPGLTQHERPVWKKSGGGTRTWYLYYSSQDRWRIEDSYKSEGGGGIWSEETNLTSIPKTGWQVFGGKSDPGMTVVGR